MYHRPTVDDPKRSPPRPRALLLPLFAALACWPATAAAIPLLDGFGGPAGYGTSILNYNDDGSSAAIDIRRVFPRGLNFFGTLHTTMWVNNNGNVSFRGAIPDYTPEAFPIAQQPMIAPWWGDVDTRGADRPARAGVYWHLEDRRIIATWFMVGYYDRHYDKTNSFQLVITPRGTCDDGDFDVEFRYARCEWTTGEAMGGIGGECPANTPMCVNAAVGFAGGPSREGMELPNSRTPQVVQVCRGTNAGIPGVWRYRVRNGVVSQ